MCRRNFSRLLDESTTRSRVTRWSRQLHIDMRESPKKKKKTFKPGEVEEEGYRGKNDWKCTRAPRHNGSRIGEFLAWVAVQRVHLFTERTDSALSTHKI